MRKSSSSEYNKTKVKLFQATEKIIKEKSASPTITNITKEAGISRSYFYKFFNNTEEFFDEFINASILKLGNYSNAPNISFKTIVIQMIGLLDDWNQNEDDLPFNKLVDTLSWFIKWLELKMRNEYPDLSETQISFISGGIIGVYYSYTHKRLNQSETKKALKQLLNLNLESTRETDFPLFS